MTDLKPSRETIPLRLSLQRVFRFVLILIAFWGLGGYAQSPLLVFNHPDHDEYFSTFLPLNDKAIISFNSYFHNTYLNIRESSVTMIMVNQLGGIDTTFVLDANSYFGYGVGLKPMLQKSDTLYQFGSLHRPDNSEHRMVIRRSDLSLNHIDDFIFNLDQRLVSVSDAITDGDDFLISGWVETGSINHGFVMRIDNQLKIVDSIFFPFQPAPWFTFALHTFPSGDLRLFITSAISESGILFYMNKTPLQLSDTLYSFGMSTAPSQGQMTNPHGIRINNTVVISPNEILPPNVPDTIIKEIGWLKWDLHGNVLDTLRPHKDTVIAGRIGHDKPMLIYHDTIAMLYSHDNDWLQFPPNDSTKVALIFADLQGNMIKTSYLGTGYWFWVENLIRFDNGNFLATARGQSFADWPIVSSNHLFVWLLNSQGDVIQSTTIPIQYSGPAISVYPNPASSEINFALDHDIEKISAIELYDMQGRRVAVHHPNQTIASLHIADLPNGIYIARVNLGNRVLTRKVVKSD